ncbi:ADP-forming succinate--CoA ligase subunit beta [Pelagibius sp.]|uniref:ADP-forming succinate--CoA ligase subunit beta n=1 Tax=Pelagibius sp. TaxID=1931238 RepID=UPI00261F496E|nr:ADP-forming succinate--CoA ligase subunit beta [Pelagibius sp.]
MNLHEHQAKEILGRYGVPSPAGSLVSRADAAAAAAKSLGGSSWAVKAQIHAGLRHDAGGVRLVSGTEAAATAASELLGKRLVTPQTGPSGKLVRSVYIEQAVGAARELYLAILIDRSQGRVAFLASRTGGSDIEQRAQAEPGSLRHLAVDGDHGFDLQAAAGLAADLGLEGRAASQAVEIMAALYKAFLELDASLIEINPLALTHEGSLTALDVKMVLDDNALFRHKDLAALRDVEELDPTELEAQRFALNYVHLDGNIGVMVNGAGLALATLDLLKQRGGAPADFMDIRPEASRDQVAEGFRLLLRNQDIDAILVNVYGGGILRCDTVAEGIAAACRSEGLRVPLIVRAAGTNGELARKTLMAQGVAFTPASSIGAAVASAVEAAGREAA